MKYISPSLLGFDKSKVVEQIQGFKGSKICSIHYDVMDNVYVPNKSFEFEFLNSIKENQLEIDVHLMCCNVLGVVKKYLDFDVRSIAVHPDADSKENISEALQMIQDTKRIALALALKNNQNLSEIFEWLKQVKFVIVMGVNPGFGGQKYLVDTTKFLQELQSFKKEHQLNFSVILDGGVTTEIILLTKDWVDIFVSGSFLMKQEKPLVYSNELFQIINS